MALNRAQRPRVFVQLCSCPASALRRTCHPRRRRERPSAERPRSRPS
jgi:hypothetical protein